MDDMTREAAGLYEKLDDGGKLAAWKYIIVVAVMDKLNDPELNRMNDDFQQRLKDQTLTRAEHIAMIERMIARVNELTQKDKSPLYGILRR